MIQTVGIKGRIYGTAILLLLILAISSIYSLFILYSIQQTNIEFGQINRELIFVHEYTTLLNEFNRSFIAATATGTTDSNSMLIAEGELRKLSYLVQLDEAQQYEQFIFAYSEIQYNYDRYHEFTGVPPEWASENVIGAVQDSLEIANAQSMELQDLVTKKVYTSSSFITTGLQISIALWAIIFIAGVLASTLLSRSIVIPLKQLSAAAHELSNGNLSARAHMMRDDEFGKLSATLNSVVDQLEHSHTRLEQQVEERTQELDETKHNLESIVAERTKELEQIKRSLEEEVRMRTVELEEKLSDMEKMNQLMVGREMKMIALKERIQELEEENV